MLLEKLQEELKQAILSRDETKVSTLRLALAEIHNAQIAKGADLSDQEVVAVLQKEAKKRREAMAGFESAGRRELVQKEEAELKILESYLPPALTDEELTKIVEDSINEVGARSSGDYGRVMGAVMGKVSGRADGSRVGKKVSEKLSQGLQTHG